MSNTTPSTPDTRSQQRLATNRSFTVPAKLATNARNGPTAEIGAAEGIETLYVHPSANVVKFTTSGPWSRSSDIIRPSTPNGGGTLPWASSTERTMAAGPLEIYRVPGSVSFLHSGALLHAILPRSQCWCVDGVSKFALRVLQDTYYRIELPGATHEDLEKVEEFKVTLAKVLFYERTPCPFARTFAVDLPEQPEERRRKSRTSHGPAKKWKLHRAYSWKPEDGGEPPRGTSSGSDVAGSEEDSDARAMAEQSDGEGSNVSEMADEVKGLGIGTRSRRPASPVRRSVTAPIPTPSVSQIRTSFDTDGTVDSQSASSTPARLDAARLRTFQHIPTDMPPSPPDSSAGMELPETPLRTERVVRQMSASRLEQAEADRTEQTDALDDEPRAEDGPIAPQTEPLTAVADQQADSVPPQEVPEQTFHPQTKPQLHLTTSSVSSSPPDKSTLHRDPSTSSSPDDPFAAIQARIHARRSIGGTTSFHPTRTSPSTSSSSSTATLTSRTSTSSRTDRQQAFATAMVKKACAAFLGPPAHLVAIMLRIAARFASGAFGGVFYVESPRGHKRVPGSFDLRSLDADEFDEGEGGEEWGEDDFGVPLRSPIRLASFAEGARVGLRERERESAGWDVD